MGICFPGRTPRTPTRVPEHKLAPRGRPTPGRWLQRGRTALLVAAAFMGGAVASRLAEATPQGASPFAMFDQIARVLVVVENAYVDPTSRDRLVEGAIEGMVAELDPHSAYMNREDYADFRSDTDGRFGGIGVEVDFRDDAVTVIAPIDGSPAARGGVKSGDKIVAIDGRPTRGVSADKLVRMMRGDAGTKVHVDIVRAGASELISLDLVREIVEVASVESKRLDRDIAYLRLKQFQSGSHDELLDAIGKTRAAAPAKLRGVILDLRNDPGGLVDEAEGIADEFLDGGVIYTTRHRGKVVDEVRASGGGALVDLPVVVLMNEYSASSSELVAGALRDNGRATVVGARSFGKGSVQTIFDLPDGAGLRLTTMRYYTPSGRTIQAEGIQPDVWIRAEGADETAIYRESNLEGHLVGEAASQANKQQVVVPAPKGDQPYGRVATMPADPAQGPDFALAEAWRRLSGAFKQKAAAPDAAFTPLPKQ